MLEEDLLQNPYSQRGRNYQNRLYNDHTMRKRAEEYENEGSADEVALPILATCTRKIRRKRIFRTYSN